MSPPPDDSALQIDYVGEIVYVAPATSLSVGREADLVIDDNPFLHRTFLVFSQQADMWFVANVGAQLSATLSDPEGRLEAFLGPDATLPIVLPHTRIAFTAGPTTYELIVRNPAAAYQAPRVSGVAEGDTTIGPSHLTRDQRLLIVALAEPRLRGDGKASVVIPSSADAAARLGWTSTKFTRKLDNVCDKLSKLGVRGLRGDVGRHASNRRSRLVEYAVATRLVTRDDLSSLDAGS